MDQSGDSTGSQPRRKNSYIPGLDGLAAMFAGQSHANETMDFVGDDSDTFSNAGSMQSYMDEMDQPGPQRTGPVRRRSVFKMMSAPNPAELDIPAKHLDGPSRRVSCGDAPQDLKALHQLEKKASHGMLQNSILNWLAFKPQQIDSINEDHESWSPPSFQSPQMQKSMPISDAAVSFTAVGKERPQKGFRSLNVMTPTAW